MSVLDPTFTQQSNQTGSTQDERWMKEALELAHQSVALASPNPAVGCVLVKDDAIIGRGFHEYDRLDHAEVVALREAGSEARGSTAYVTLEPCCHTGRTGPCTDALIQAGVDRVVVAAGDPNPSVNGQGMDRLRAAGIAVDAGVL
ncbi:MAG: bifunctional diaminohydroxyphosphoribosylaminopyrimidine deaminase/5-amino-6-(5-phosphoribosylamino)uracil reductase RibD, partial [Silvibacterium sp.]|nr:bifunctional diaminohydroxyphosphoribosylaminopyrimidine deaminase/5-amino-6-(5-phosphoribosylamino)uracil reductase RibD [Silvibacterium sp.]